MTPLHHAYLLKGWLLDKHPPKEVTEAVEAILAVLESSVAPDRITGDPACMAIQIEQSELAGAISEVEAAKTVETPTPEKSRRQSNMSPEARAAAAERMRAYQARKKAEREAASHGKKPAPAHREPEQPQFEIRRASAVPPTPVSNQQEAKPKPLAPIDPDRLITVHRGYAGKREDGTLTDDDWPDIKARLARSEEVKAIASDYDISEEDLGFFIASCQRREGKSPGEALASPSSVASGATQRRT